ncbi:MAG: hypothetical protein IKC39_00490 [Clostridia bacterium]|nr:hypothetical protein [Clostridia bacterium]
MKRILILILTCLSLLLLSCSAKENSPKFSLPLKIGAKLSGTDVVFTADISENGCDVIFESPEELKNVILKFREDGNTAKVGDFERKIKKNTFPAQESFIDAIRKIASSEEFIASEEGTKYTIDETVIMVYYDKDNDAIKRIETEENGRRFCFDVVGLKFYEAQSESEG